jgi:MFS transporter, OFA family, oxalate/formate antiporter
MLPMTAELGWSRAEYAAPRSFGYFIMAAVGFWIGPYLDRYGARPLMLCGVAIATLSLWSLAYVETWLGWFVLNGVALSVGAALCGNLVVNVTLSKWFVVRRGLAVAIGAMGVSSAGLIATPGVIWAIDSLGWRDAWGVLALGAAVLGLPVALMMRRAPGDYGLHPDGKSDAQIRAGAGAMAARELASSMTRAQAFRMPVFYLLVLAFGLLTINITVVLLHGIPYLLDAGFSPSVAAGAMFVTSVPAMVTKPVWGYLIDRYEGRYLAAIGGFATGSALVAIVATVQARSQLGVYFAFALLGFGWGGLIPIQEVIWARFFGRRHLGAVRSAALPFALAISASAPLAVAWYHDSAGSYPDALAVVAALTCGAATLMLFLRTPHNGQVHANTA